MAESKPFHPDVGGYEQLPRKVLTYLFPQVYKQFNGQYDFLIKADPDTYLNIERLEKVPCLCYLLLLSCSPHLHRSWLNFDSTYPCTWARPGVT